MRITIIVCTLLFSIAVVLGDPKPETYDVAAGKLKIECNQAKTLMTPTVRFGLYKTLALCRCDFDCQYDAYLAVGVKRECAMQELAR